MMEPSDIRAGLALGAGGLLCLCAWVWQDAGQRSLRLRGLWAGLVFLTAGIGTLPYLAASRKREGKTFWTGLVVWAVWMVFLGVGSTALVILAEKNREASTLVARTTIQAPGPQIPTPSWGDFQKAFSPAPPPPPASTSR